jgi:hypothetical protein
MTTKQDIMDLAFDGVEADEIAVILGLTVDQVLDAIEGYVERDYDDSMDGDFDSAMASAGYGMDEDYGSASEFMEYEDY